VALNSRWSSHTGNKAKEIFNGFCSFTLAPRLPFRPGGPGVPGGPCCPGGPGLPMTSSLDGGGTKVDSVDRYQLGDELARKRRHCSYVARRRTPAQKRFCLNLKHLPTGVVQRSEVAMFSAASVCQFVRTISSERLNVGRSNLAVRYIIQKSRPSSKVKVKGQGHQGQKKKKC